VVVSKGFFGPSNVYSPFKQTAGNTPFARFQLTQSTASLLSIKRDSSVPKGLAPSTQDSVEIRKKTTSTIASSLITGKTTEAARYTGAQLATAELTDTITQIKSLTDRYQNGRLGASAKAALKNELLALTARYNTLVGAPATYTAEDTQVFEKQIASASSLSRLMSQRLKQASSSLDPISSSIEAIGSTVSTITSSLSSLSSVSQSLTSADISLLSEIESASQLSTILESDLSQLDSVVSERSSATALLLDSSNQLSGFLSTIESSLLVSQSLDPALVSSSESLSALITSTSGSLASIESEIGTMSSQILDRSGSIDSISAEVYNSLSPYYDAINPSITSLQADLTLASSLSAQYAYQRSSFDALSEQLNSKNSALQSAQAAYDAAAAALSSMYPISSYISYYSTDPTSWSVIDYATVSWWESSYVSVPDSSWLVSYTASSTYTDSSWSSNMVGGSWVSFDVTSSWEETSWQSSVGGYTWVSSEVTSSYSVGETWYSDPGSSWSELVSETSEQFISRVSSTNEYASMTGLSSEFESLSNRFTSENNALAYYAANQMGEVLAQESAISQYQDYLTGYLGSSADLDSSSSSLLAQSLGSLPPTSESLASAMSTLVNSSGALDGSAAMLTGQLADINGSLNDNSLASQGFLASSAAIIGSVGTASSSLTDVEGTIALLGAQRADVSSSIDAIQADIYNSLSPYYGAINPPITSLQADLSTASSLSNLYAYQRDGYNSLYAQANSTSALLSDRSSSYDLALAALSLMYPHSSYYNYYSTPPSSWSQPTYAWTSSWESSSYYVPDSSWLVSYFVSSSYNDSSWSDDGMGGGNWVYFDTYTSSEESSWESSLGGFVNTYTEVSSSYYTGDVWYYDSGSAWSDLVMEDDTTWLSRVSYTGEYWTVSYLSSEIGSLTSRLSSEDTSLNYYAAYQMNEVLAYESQMGVAQNALAGYYNSSSDLDYIYSSRSAESLTPLAVAAAGLTSDINTFTDSSTALVAGITSYGSQLSDLTASLELASLLNQQYLTSSGTIAEFMAATSSSIADVTTSIGVVSSQLLDVGNSITSIQTDVSNAFSNYYSAVNASIISLQADLGAASSLSSLYAYQRESYNNLAAQLDVTSSFLNDKASAYSSAAATFSSTYAPSEYYVYSSTNPSSWSVIDYAVGTYWDSSEVWVPDSSWMETYTATSTYTDSSWMDTSDAGGWVYFDTTTTSDASYWESSVGGWYWDSSEVTSNSSIGETWYSDPGSTWSEIAYEDSNTWSSRISGTSESYAVTSLASEINILADAYNSVSSAIDYYSTYQMGDIIAQETAMATAQNALAGFYTSSSDLDASASSLLAPSLAPMIAARDTLVSLLSTTSNLSSDMAGALSSGTARLSEIQSSIDNFTSLVSDPLMVASSIAVSASLDALGSALAEAQSSLSVTLESSSSLLGNTLAVASLLGALLQNRSSVSDSLVMIEDDIEQLSSNTTLPLGALASISSRFSSLGSQFASLSSGLAYVASETLALEAASSSARLEASSSSNSSISSDTLKSALRNFDIAQGIKVDFSTNGLIAVTREIVNNRLTQLAGAQAAIRTVNQGLQSAQQQINKAASALDTLSRIQEQPLKLSGVTSFSQSVARNAFTSPTLALGAIGPVRVQTVLNLLASPTAAPPPLSSPIRRGISRI
jgi:hypothetical protein